MKELSQILDRAARLREQERPFALATVVKINGSTYRRPGARMLVTPDGERLGTISGGCLEGEVAQQALQVIEDGRPRVEAFDLSNDDLILGFGIGCNGQAHVLIEPVPANDRRDPLRLIETCRTRRRTGLITTVIDAPEGTDALGRCRLAGEASSNGDASSETSATLGLGALDDAVRADTAEALDEGQTQIRQYDLAPGRFEVLFEVVEPPVRLVIFGDGHDVKPVVETAAGLGWAVTLVGAKAAEELAERFPAADAHVFLMHPEEASEQLSFDARTAGVTMNHQYERDKALLGTLLASPAAYVGALGPRERTEYIASELKDEQPGLSDDAFEKLHGPVGLDIGTETPEEIALAIVAEVQATLSGRSAQKLREREGSIHERVAVS